MCISENNIWNKIQHLPLFYAYGVWYRFMFDKFKRTMFSFILYPCWEIAAYFINFKNMQINVNVFILYTPFRMFADKNGYLQLKQISRYINLIIIYHHSSLLHSNLYEKLFICVWWLYVKNTSDQVWTVLIILTPSNLT